MQGSIYFCDQEYLCWGITILVKNHIAKIMKSVVVISMEASTKLIIWWVLSRGTSVLLLYSLILCFNSVVYIPLSLLNPLWTKIERCFTTTVTAKKRRLLIRWLVVSRTDDAVPRAVIGCLVFWGTVWSWRNISWINIWLVSDCCSPDCVLNWWNSLQMQSDRWPNQTV